MNRGNKWLCLKNNRFVRKSEIVSYQLVGKAIEIYTPYYSFIDMHDNEEQAKKSLEWFHLELINS